MGILWLVDRRPNLAGFNAVPPDGVNGAIVIEANPSHSSDGSGALPLANVLAAGAALGPYDLVRVVSHGAPGDLHFSRAGVTDKNSGDFGALHGQIRSPRHRVGIEIHGCGVASSYLPQPRSVRDTHIGIPDTFHTVWDNGSLNYGGWAAISDERALLDLPGIRLLVRMAIATGVGVKAGINYQWSDAAWAYEGPAISILHGAVGLRLVLDDPANQLHRGTRMELPV